MLRLVCGVLLGYVSMLAVIFFGMHTVYFFMGADLAFEPGSYDASLLWIGFFYAVSLFGAVIGGIVAAAIGRRWLAPNSLAVLVFVLFVIHAVFELSTTRVDPGPRTNNVNNLDAMTHGRQPQSIALSLPVIGAVGVLLGARLVNPKPPLTSKPSV